MLFPEHLFEEPTFIRIVWETWLAFKHTSSLQDFETNLYL